MLLLLIFKAQKIADAHAGHGRLLLFNKKSKTYSPSSEQQGHDEVFSSIKKKKNAAHQNNNFDEIFGADKRKVRTGPNPLHNR